VTAAGNTIPVTINVTTCRRRRLIRQMLVRAVRQWVAIWLASATKQNGIMSKASRKYSIDHLYKLLSVLALHYLVRLELLLLSMSLLVVHTGCF